jgi:hypothetical protein
VDWIHLAQDRVQWRDLVNTVISEDLAASIFRVKSSQYMPEHKVGHIWRVFTLSVKMINFQEYIK